MDSGLDLDWTLDLFFYLDYFIVLKVFIITACSYSSATAVYSTNSMAILCV